MHNGSFELTGRVALVTGGTSGIGRATSVALMEAGAYVMATSRQGLRGMDQRFAGQIDSVAVEFATAGEAECEDLVAHTVSKLGGLDILVNNAGATVRAPALDLSEEEWHRVLHINLTIPFLLSRSVARRMSRESGGAIVNIASLLSFQGGMNTSAYTASKSGLVGITRALSNEWAGRGIRVNAVAPGYTETDLTAELRRDPERLKSINDRIPADRWGRPDDVAKAVAFLASDMSRYVQGATLTVDGGWMAR